MKKLNVAERLKETKFKNVSDALGDEFQKAGIDTVEKLGNAPILVQTTHGADIYEVIELLKTPAKTTRKLSAAKESDNDRS